MQPPNLEDLSLGRRVMLTVVIIVIVLLLIACIGYLSGRWEAAAETARLPPTKYDDRMLALARAAVDEGYKQKLEQLFGIWLRDSTDQPRRLFVGSLAARKAYVGAMTWIDEEEEHLKKSR